MKTLILSLIVVFGMAIATPAEACPGHSSKSSKASEANDNNAINAEQLREESVDLNEKAEISKKACGNKNRKATADNAEKACSKECCKKSSDATKDADDN